MYNPLSFALAVDALQNGGPGQPSPIDLNGTCSQGATTGLDALDVIETEASILIAAYTLVTFDQDVDTEPPLMSYATGGSNTTYSGSGNLFGGLPSKKKYRAKKSFLEQ